MNADKTQKLTHAARFERRRLIAEAVKSGQKQSTVARMFGVSIRTVADACAEYEVRAGSASTTTETQQVQPA